VTRAEDGQVVYEAAYLPYGQTRAECSSGAFANCNASFAPKYKYNFKELDAAGYYDYGARRYDPTTGRFLSADSATADGFNRYAYVSNNPLGFVDPSGHAKQLGDGASQTPNEAYQSTQQMGERITGRLLVQ
jgi:RHS repeat-associated protein